jgi:hypothetical protein
MSAYFGTDHLSRRRDPHDMDRVADHVGGASRLGALDGLSGPRDMYFDRAVFVRHHPNSH